MTTQVQKLYRKFRGTVALVGADAAMSLKYARIMERWEELEIQGLVRLETPEDDSFTRHDFDGGKCSKDHPCTECRAIARGDVRRAIPDGVKIFRVNLAPHCSEQQYYAEMCREVLNLLTQVHKAKARANDLFRQAVSLDNQCAKFARDFSLETHTPIVTPAIRTSLADHLAKQALAVERSNARLAEKQAQREEQRRLEAMEYEKQSALEIADWLAGNYAAGRWRWANTYLRVKPGTEDTIETSRGAEFPIAHGERAYRLLKALHDAGRSYHRNGHTIHCGAFTVDSLEGDDVRAGCHTLQWSEIERFAGVMGWSEVLV